MTKNRGNLPVAHLYSLIGYIQESPSNSTSERAQVFESFEGLVHSRVRKFCYPRSSHFEDCLQEAYVGLARAVERFDMSRGVQFSTFATRVIDRRIIDFLDSERRLHDCPLGRRVTVGEPDVNGIVVDLEDLATIESPENAVIWAIDTERLSPRLRCMIDDLPTRQQHAIKLFYGAELPNSAVARLMRVSRPRVTALLAGALCGLRRRVRIGL